MYIVSEVSRLETYFEAMFNLFDLVKEYVFYLDFSCKFSKLQYKCLAFVADLKRASDEGLLPYYLPLMFYCFQRIKRLYFIPGS